MKPASLRSSETKNEDTFAPDACTVRISREERDPDWDSFLMSCPGGHHEQTGLWAEVKGFYGWQPVRIVVTREKRILGGVQVLTRCFGRWGRIGYVTRGPLVASDGPQLIDFILGQLDYAAKSERLSYVAVVPPYTGHVYEPGLVRLGFRQKPNVLPPSGLMTATLVLDLSSGMDSLMARMRSKTRQHIRRAFRKGVTVREGTGADVETFRRLMWALCERRGTTPTPPQKDFFEHLWKTFQPSGLVRLFIAELAGNVVSALVTFPFGDAVQAWKIGWAGDHAEDSPNEMLYWEAIRWSKRNGYRFFDFVGIEDTLARRLQDGDQVDWTSVKGPSNFKVGFGGSPVLLPKPYYRFYHPILRTLAGAGGSKMIESAAVAGFLGRFRDRLSSPGEG